MKDAAWVRAAVVAGRGYHINKKKPWVHNAINLSNAALLLGVIGALAWAGRSAPSALYICLAPWGFGLLYFALFILVVHEASHGMFVISSNRRLAHSLNRIAGTVVALFFATNYKKHWERGHLEHHVRPLSPHDPQRHNTLVGKALLWRILACVLVPGFLLFERTPMRTRATGSSSSSRTTMVGFFAVALCAFLLVSELVALRSAVSMLLGIHVIAALNHIKGSLEHGGSLRLYDKHYLRSRSTFFPLRHLLMPFNISLHFEHHLNYRIPWYDLPEYHRVLRAIVPPEVASHVWNHRPLAQLSGDLS